MAGARSPEGLIPETSEPFTENDQNDGMPPPPPQGEGPRGKCADSRGLVGLRRAMCVVVGCGLGEPRRQGSHTEP